MVIRESIVLSSKKKQILQAAFALFTEKGFKATTTKEIALKCGVAEGLIFYYFKDKEDLLKSLTREFSFIESIREKIKELSGMDPVSALIRFGQLYTHFLSHQKSFLFFIWSPEMLQKNEVSDEVVKLIQSMTEFVEVNLQRAVSDSVDMQKIETAASMLLSALLTHVLVGERISVHSTSENETYINTVVNLVLNGLKASS